MQGPLGDAIHAAADVQRTLDRFGWRFCFIGGIALQRWGEPRVTLDVDITLVTGFGSEEGYIRELLALFGSRVEDPVAFALRNRVLLLKTAQGIGIDIALGGLAFEEEMVDRSTSAEYLPGLYLRTCSAEDLIVMKAFAGRERDWSDVRSVIVRQRGRLDTGYILTRLTPLAEAKEQPQLVARLQAILRDEDVAS